MKPTFLFTEELWIQIRNTVVFQLTKEIRIRSKQLVYWKCTFCKSICNSKNISFSFFFFRIGWNLNVLPRLPSSVLKHVGLLQGKKIIEGRLQKSTISYFLKHVILLHRYNLFVPKLLSVTQFTRVQPNF